MNQSIISFNSTSHPSNIHSGPAIRIVLIYEEAQIWVSLFVIEGLLIITANCLSLCVFTGKKYRKNKSSILLANLAFSDLLVGCLATPLQVYTLGDSWLWQFKFPIALNVPLDMFTGFSSLFSLTAIALERLYATWSPIQYKLLKAHIYVIIIAVTWSMAVLVPCAVYFIPPDVISKYIFNYIIAVLLCLSVFLIIFSYTAIGVKMYPQNIQQDQRHQRQSHVIKTLTLVTFLSLVSWLPFQVIILTFYFSKGKYSVSSVMIVVTKFLQFGNSFVNSIVYYLRMPGFRSDLKRIVFSRTPRIPCFKHGAERIEGSGNNNQQNLRNNENRQRNGSHVGCTISVQTNSAISFVEETKL